MNKTILATALAAAATLLAGCTASQTALDNRRAQISWDAFCAQNGYDTDDNTYPTINRYLDTWVGSANEEAAFIAAGIKPY